MFSTKESNVLRHKKQCFLPFSAQASWLSHKKSVALLHEKEKQDYDKI